MGKRVCVGEFKSFVLVGANGAPSFQRGGCGGGGSNTAPSFKTGLGAGGGQCNSSLFVEIDLGSYPIRICVNVKTVWVQIFKTRFNLYLYA